MNRVPLIVVLGATGTGKSKLAIELALKYNGEIISADSMQVYKKLDIITNKVTLEERNLVPHHIIDFLNPLKRYSVVEFRNHALRTVDEIMERKKIPVIVGGTNYYIEALLWKVLVDSDEVDVGVMSEGESAGRVLMQRPLESESSGSNVHCPESMKEAPIGNLECDSGRPLGAVKNDNFQESLYSTLFYCQSVLQYVKDSLRAPFSKLFECIEPVYHIEPQVPPEELGSYPSRIFNKMFGQTDAIENIKRHKDAIQLVIKITDETFLLIFNLQKLVQVADGFLGDIELRTYVKSVLLPNMISTNIFVYTNFISALFPGMSKLRAEVSELLDKIDRISSNGNSVVKNVTTKQEFLHQAEQITEASLKNLETLVKQLKEVIVIEEDCLVHLSSVELHERLKSVDPQRASALHPNDRRKVFRSLQVYLQTAQSHSELLRLQKSQPGGSDLGGPLRFSNSCVFWIQTDQAVLDARLDKRVDEMIGSGLVQELTEFHDEYNASRLLNNETCDYTRGIFQSIGFKEFHDYLILSKEERDTEKGQKILKKCVDALKLSTRRYSRCQIKWLRNRFFRKKDRQIPPIYAINGDNVAEWDEQVLKPASEVVKCLLEGGIDSLRECSIQPIPKEMDYPQHERHKNFYCEICERPFIGTLQWNVHLKSKRHAIVVARKKKEAVKQGENVIHIFNCKK